MLVRIGEPKTRRRGAKQQYASIESLLECSFLDSVIGLLLPSERVFAACASSFRKRWDLAIKALGIPLTAAYTPGGLRGGGACSAFADLPDLARLQWRMRLQNQHTLAFYLQEVTVQTSLINLPEPVRSTISSLSRSYPDVIRRFVTS